METLENKALKRMPAVQADAQAETTALPAVALRPKVEHFAQLYASHGNAARAYREAFECSPGTKAATVRQRAYELVHEPAVAERVRQLLAVAAEHATISARARMLRLQLICEADPAEVVRVVVEPCRDCWADMLALVAAIDRAAAGDGETPDTAEPREDCGTCRGHGVQRLVLTATDRLSGSARALIKSIRQKSDGSIEVVTHDQLAASDQLNRMQGIYVERSESKNLNVNIDASVDAGDLSPDAILDAWRETRDR